MSGAMRRRLSPEERARRDARILDAIREGVPTHSVLERFGVSRRYVDALTKDARVEMHGSLTPTGGPVR